MEFSGKKYGSLPKPDEGADDETVIFMPNDPNVIESSHLWETSKRKPDVIGVPISFVHEVHEELKGMDYKQLSTKVSKESRKNLKPSRDTEWPDVYVTCELKMKKNKLEFSNCKWSANKLLKLLKQQTTVAGRKRAHGDRGSGDDDFVSKRRRGSTSTTQNVHISIVPEGTPSEPSQPSIDPETQCAYYGMERLSSLWTIMHSFVLLLEGEFFSVL